MSDRTARYLAHYRTVLQDRLGIAVAEHPLGLTFELRDGLRVILEDGRAERDPELLNFTAVFDVGNRNGAEVLWAANRASKRVVAAKVVAHDDLVTVHVQAINSAPDTLPTAEHLAATLPRILSVIVSASNALHEELVLAEHVSEVSDIDVSGDA